MKTHSVYSEFLVELQLRREYSVNSLVDLCLVSGMPLKHSSLRHLKKPSCSKCVVAQLRSMLRIGSELATLRLRRRHLSLLMLRLDSVHIGELNIFLELQEFLVMLMLDSRVHMYLMVYSPECTPTMLGPNGSDIVHHLVMSTPSTARSVDQQMLLVYQYLKKLMFMDIMVMIEIQELLVHCSELVVEQKLPA